MNSHRTTVDVDSLYAFRYSFLGIDIFRWLLPIATGALLALAFPPFNISQLAWVALIPLMISLQPVGRAALSPPSGNRPWRAEAARPTDDISEAFRRGYIAGLVFFGMTTWWVIYTTEGGAPWPAALAGVVALVAVLALYFGAWASVFAWLTGSFADADAPDATGGLLPAARNITVSVTGAATWVTLEWLRGRLLLGGFPWNFIGVSQWQSLPVIQLAATTGVYGISALIVALNGAFYFTGKRFWEQAVQQRPARRLSWEFYLAMILLCGTMMHGFAEIRRAAAELPARSLQLLLAQGNIPQTLKFDPAEKPKILDRYGSLTETNLPLDLIIWPETATPEPLRYDADSFALVTNLAVHSRAALLTGTFDMTPYSNPPQWFNAAILVRPDATLAGIYRKIHLVPFGEYVPWRKVLPFMKYLTPIPDSFERGSELTVFEVAGARFGTVICFEDTVAPLCRDYAATGIDFLVNLTNDAWFKTSPAAEMHLANALFRAIETRRPLVRCTNNGVSCVVDARGFIRARVPAFTAANALVTLDLPATRTTTYYMQHGDIFVAGCAGLTGLAIGLAAFRRHRLQSPA